MYDLHMSGGHSQSLPLLAINELLLQGLSPETRFDYYRLTRSENALLRAIWKLSQDGNCAQAIPRIAEHARLSCKTVQRLLHGYLNQSGEWKKGLMARRIVKQLSPANPALHMPAVISIDWKSLEPDPARLQFLMEADGQLAQVLNEASASDA